MSVYELDSNRSSEVFDEELTFSERQVTSRLGYTIELLDKSGRFNSKIAMPDDHSEVTHITMSDLECEDYEAYSILALFYRYMIQRYLPMTVFHKHKIINSIFVRVRNDICIEDAIDAVAITNASTATGTLKAFVEFLLIHDYQGIDLNWADAFLSLESYTQRNSYLNLFTLNETLGPFTREELRILNDAVLNIEISLSSRVILGLMLNFGLRPIQLALLELMLY